MNKLIYLGAIALLGSISSHASSCEDIAAMDERLLCYDTLAQCASLKSNTQRLACFESDGIQSRQPVEKAMQIPPTAAAQTGKVNKASSFRAETELTTGSETTEKNLETRIASTRMNRSEVLYIYLDNGQVWKEITRSRFRYQKGQKVSITRSSMGAARLHAEGMKKYAKVSLVKTRAG